MSPKHLYFFTNHYPYGGESFVGNEIEALSPVYSKIKLFSTIKGDVKDKVPSNTDLIQLNPTSGGRLNLLRNNFSLVISIFILDYSNNSDKKNFFKKFRYNLSLLLNAIAVSDELAREIEKDETEKDFVSFWMDEWTLALSVLKHKGKLKDFVFRVHQHDLYIDTNPTQYIPFRYFNIKMAKAVFPDSNRGVKFLKDLNYFPEKIKVGHLGVVDKGTNPFNKNVYTIVSCSALLNRKRVDLIADVLKLVTVPVKWVHFGAKGENEQSFKQLKSKCESLPSHISVDLRGDVRYSDLLQFYKTNPVNLFITLTRAEGLPVSVIEAVSFGIPVLATDVMGLPDVVTAESGILISPELEKEKIADILNKFPTSDKNTSEFRQGVKEFWRYHFNSDVNYSKFSAFLNN